jgi:hypothetical protein
MNQTLSRPVSGRRAPIAEQICAIVEFDQAGADLEKLADKMVYAQLSLARQGFSTGGRLHTAFGDGLSESTETEVADARAQSSRWPSLRSELFVADVSIPQNKRVVWLQVRAVYPVPRRKMLTITSMDSNSPASFSQQFVSVSSARTRLKK